jgi:alkylhydroperoxidase family enzyme
MALGRRAGLADRQIAELDQFEASDAYSPLEKDVLRFTEQWAGRGRVDPAVVARLKGILPDSHLVLLAATVGQANFTTRFNVTFGVELP